MYEVTITTDTLNDTLTVDADNPEEAENLALVEFEAEYGDHALFAEFNMDAEWVGTPE